MEGGVKKSRGTQPQQNGGGDLLTSILTFPVLGAPRMVYWLAKKLTEAAEQEQDDEGKLEGALLELQIRYEVGEIKGEEYAEQEAAILNRLSAIRGGKEEE